MGWAPATAGARCEFQSSHAPHRRRGAHRPSRAARKSCGSLSRRRCPPSRAAHPMAGPVRTASNATAPSICYRNSRAFSTCQQRGQHLAQVLQELLHSRVRLLPRTPATRESPIPVLVQACRQQAGLQSVWGRPAAELAQAGHQLAARHSRGQCSGRTFLGTESVPSTSKRAMTRFAPPLLCATPLLVAMVLNAVRKQGECGTEAQRIAVYAECSTG